MVHLLRAVPFGILFSVIRLGFVTSDINLSTDDTNDVNSCHNNDDLEMDKYSRFKNLPAIETVFGHIYGQIDTFHGEEVMTFRDIRYAKPPVDALRFAKPQPLDATTVERVGLQSSQRVSCVQPKNFLTKNELIVSEDCLHLNVWVPLSEPCATDIDSNRLPVMLWIHGGSFHIGSGNQDSYDGIALASVGRVIVVTLNYRLGFFGFLNAEMESAAGNMGLYDQAAALLWVRENIRKFGGDPESITVFGQSAGGLAAGLLAVSPLTRNLFRRTIIGSGSPYSPLRPEPKDEVLRKSLLFSQAMNCSGPNEVEFNDQSLQCLRDLDYQLINDYGRTESVHSQILPNPLIGDAFVPANVYTQMERPDSMNPNSEVLIGMTRDEGFFFVYPQLRNVVLSPDNSDSLTKDDALSLVAKVLNGRSVDPVQVTNYYFQNMTTEWDTQKVLDTIADMYGDLYINCPVHFLAKRFTKLLGYERTFTYMLTEASSQSFVPVCTGRSKVCHGDELTLIFGVPLRKPHTFEDSDQVFSKRLVHFWSNFARTGKVNWINNPDNWFKDISLADTSSEFHTEKRNACDAFWWEIFEEQLRID